MVRRRTLISTVLAVAALAGPAAAGAQDKPLRVRLTACHHGTTAVDRYLQTTSRVRLVPRSVRVVLRYELLWRAAGTTHFSRYPAPAFERRFRKASEHVYTVGNLPVGAVYRLHVRARWFGPGSGIVRTDHHLTRGCRQPDTRPDLTVARFVRVGPKRFAAVIRNIGDAAAGSFYVGDRDGDAQGNLLVSGLAPGQSTRISIAACHTVIVDSASRIDESDEANNSASAPCRAG